MHAPTKYSIAELIDLPALQSLMESLYRATGIKHALIDNDSQVLTAAGWEPVCTEFHRKHPVTCRRCEASDRHILEHLRDAQYVSYECLNGLMDFATPVVIGGDHVANIFTGQVLHAPPDLEAFRRQAAEFGFDEAAYLEAVRRVPVVPRERMPDIMRLLVGLAETLGQQGLLRLRQFKAEQELRQLNQDLAERVRARTRELEEKNDLLHREIERHEFAQDALRQEKRFSDDAINSMPGIFYMLDTEGCLVRWNRKLAEVTGYADKELRDLPALQLFDEETAALIRERIGQVFAQGESSVEAALLTKDGRRIFHYFTGRRTQIGEHAYLVGLGIDVTERRALEQELKKQAHEDSLTGMATRRHFFALVEREQARSKRYGCPLSFLMIDIDNFKDINDRHGHGIGDQVLSQFAATCRTVLREADIVGRIGGDEFAVLLPATDSERARTVGERLREAVEAIEIANGGVAVRCTISVGASTLAGAAGVTEVLFAQADAALYRAKQAGRNCCVAFEAAT